MAHHFISYSTADAADFALRLADALTAGPPTMPVWLDRRDIQKGRDWDTEIEVGIQECRCLLFVMTTDSVRNNSVCKDEWSLALAEKKPIVTLRLHAGVEPPFRLKQRQYIDFSQDFDAGLAELRLHLQWLVSPEGIVQALKDRLLDAERELARTFDQTSRQQLEAMMANLRREIIALEGGSAPQPEAATPIIDRAEAVALFSRLLDPNRDERYLRMLGGPKMGKSHLLAKVFPRIAVEAGIACVVVDLRNREFSLVDHLRFITRTLGQEHFPQFDAAYRRWRERSLIEGKDLQAILYASATRSEESRQLFNRHMADLAQSLVDDLHDRPEAPLVLLFDAAERADETVQAWLMDNLLVQLYPAVHVSAVVAGRPPLHEPSGAYVSACRSVTLERVEEVDEYIHYCRAIGANLVDQSIRDFAHAFDYVPGIFAEAVQTFVGGDTGYD